MSLGTRGAMNVIWEFEFGETKNGRGHSQSTLEPHRNESGRSHRAAAPEKSGSGNSHLTVWTRHSGGATLVRLRRAGQENFPKPNLAALKFCLRAGNRCFASVPMCLMSGFRISIVWESEVKSRGSLRFEPQLLEN